MNKPTSQRWQQWVVAVVGLILIAAVVVSGYAWYSGFFAQQTLQPGQVVQVATMPSGANLASSLPAPSSVPYQLESVVSGLDVPWSVVFPSASRWLISERPGQIRVVLEGKLLEAPLATFPEVSHAAEEGLMGLVLDPQYSENNYVYACLAYTKGDRTVDKVIRFTDLGTSIGSVQTIFDDIPAARFHAGCRLQFGPDGKLYITTGDATKKELAQDKTALNGKILRLQTDGSIPADNPFPGSPVYSFGHRNPQGLAWNKEGLMVATEHGPSGNDGPGGGDEVNVIRAGQNYGWPVVSHRESRSEMVSPVIEFTPAVAPAGGVFYQGSVFPQWQNRFLFGLLRGTGIIAVTFDPTVPGKVVSYEKVLGIDVGRVRDVVEGPDGFIYFTTSNRDGRGALKTGDDHLYRIIPQK